MEYTIQYREDQNIVVATAKGEWQKAVDNAMVHEIMVTVQATGSLKVLLDLQELHFDFPIIRILDRAREVREQRQEFDTVSRKVAIVYSSTDEKVNENLMLFETVARNRSLPYMTFIDMDKALGWLLGSA